MQAQPKQGFSSASIALVVLLIVGVVVVGAIMLASATGMFNPPAPTAQIAGVTVLTPPEPVPEFILTNQHGEPVSLSDLDGKLSLVYFGYTFCPDFCPLTLEKFKQVHASLGDQGDEVNYVFISVDPERDTLERIQLFLEARGMGDFAIGLRGTEDEIRTIGSRPFGVFFEDNLTTVPTVDHSEHTGQLIDHNTQSYLLDRNGDLQAIFSFDTPADVMTTSVRQFL